MGINFGHPTDTTSDPIDILWKVDEDSWELLHASGKPSDIAWLWNKVEMVGAPEALECDVITEDLKLGEYRATIRIVGHWYASDDYEDWVECTSFSKV